MSVRSSAPCERVTKDQVDAVNVIRSQEPKQPRWIRVNYRRRKKLTDQELRTLVIWGAPLDFPALRVPRVLLGRVAQFSSCKWRGEGAGRHLALVFYNSMAMLAQKDDVIKQCRRLGWNAVPARSYQRREEHRLSKNHPQIAPSSPVSELGDGLVSNTYGVLAQHRAPCELCPPPPLSQQERPSRAAPPNSRIPNTCNLSLLSLNVGKGLRDKIGELEEYFAKQAIDIAALQEYGGKKVDARGYKQFHHKNGDTCFFVAYHLVPYVVALPVRKDGYLWIKITASGRHRPLYICSAYMPQESDSVDQRTSRWKVLEDEFVTYSGSGEVAIMGDLNARSGSPMTAEERGPFLESTANQATARPMEN